LSRVVAITGVAGFIGGHVARQLLTAGVSVLGIDNMSTGSPATVARLAELGGDRFAFRKADIRDADGVAKAMSPAAGRALDGVAHLAAALSVPMLEQQPDLAIATNVVGFANVAAAARELGASRVVYATTSAVYGESAAAPIVETAATRPISVYGWSKLANERTAAALESPGFSLIGLRMFNVFGPGQAADGPYAAVVARWMAAAEAGETLEIYGDGRATRDFVFVEDAAGVFAFLLRNTVATPRILNVGSSRTTELLDLRDAIARATTGRSDDLPVRHLPQRQADIRHSVANIARLRDAFPGYAPIALDAGLATMASGTQRPSTTVGQIAGSRL